MIPASLLIPRDPPRRTGTIAPHAIDLGAPDRVTEIVFQVHALRKPRDHRVLGNEASHHDGRLCNTDRPSRQRGASSSFRRRGSKHQGQDRRGSSDSPIGFRMWREPAVGSSLKRRHKTRSREATGGTATPGAFLVRSRKGAGVPFLAGALGESPKTVITHQPAQGRW